LLIHANVRSTTHLRGRTLEPGQVIGLLDDLDGEGEDLVGEGDQASGVPAVGPHVGDGGEPFPQQRQQSQAAIAVLDAGHGDQHDQQ
jgi:hypothetical protein